MTHHDLMVEEFLKRQAAARRVLLAPPTKTPRSWS